MSEEKKKNYITKLVRLARELRWILEQPITGTKENAKKDYENRQVELTAKLMYLVGYIEALEESNAK